MRARLGQVPSLLNEWREPGQLRESIRKFLYPEIERLHSAELAELFAHHCPVSGAVVADYFNKLLELPGFGEALIGIRFWNLDLDRPFITVAASTRLPANLEELRAALQTLAEQYEVFKPKHVRLFLPSHNPLQPGDDRQYWEKRLIAAPITRLLLEPVPQGYERVELKAGRDAGWYADYCRVFVELVEVSPQYREYTHLESEESLADLVRAGTLYEVYVDDRWAGITAVDEDNVEGVNGYVMIEIILDRLARGERLATAVQRHLVEWLPNETKLLLGTIDSRNTPAIKASIRLGRKDLGGYLWAPL